MMTLKVSGKKYNIKFGYEPTLKTRLLSRMAKIGAGVASGDENLEKIEDMLLFVPDVLLIGLQNQHGDEFGYNLDTKDGYEESKEKAFSLVADYLDNENGDAIELFTQLQDELTKNGFLKKMFEMEMEKATAEISNEKNEEN